MVAVDPYTQIIARKNGASSLGYWEARLLFMRQLKNYVVLVAYCY